MCMPKASFLPLSSGNDKPSTTDFSLSFLWNMAERLLRYHHPGTNVVLQVPVRVTEEKEVDGRKKA